MNIGITFCKYLKVFTRFRKFSQDFTKFRNFSQGTGGQTDQQLNQLMEKSRGEKELFKILYLFIIIIHYLLDCSRTQANLPAFLHF
ncbi:hypothetical protein C2G38_2152269 [Gigaspora rosea]|uniref:Uncharacterized protein n=1 Tax=Gigaspora rosea TaxID=44941 RepID=A0A397WAJ3_9GLOM|nr:hypothetical protein C2G38_2152269 [Gigaspora rosea]